MTEIVIEFDHDRPFTHVMIVPKQSTYQDVIDRLHLTCLWRYIFICKKTDNIVETINECNHLYNYHTMIEPCKITIYQLSFCPILFYKNIFEIECNIYNIYKPVVIWFNYIKSELQPIYIYFYEKDKKNEWHENVLSAINFEDIENAIQSNVFFTTKIARQRLVELKENL